LKLGKNWLSKVILLLSGSIFIAGSTFKCLICMVFQVLLRKYIIHNIWHMEVVNSCFWSCQHLRWINFHSDGVWCEYIHWTHVYCVLRELRDSYHFGCLGLHGESYPSHHYHCMHSKKLYSKLNNWVELGESSFIQFFLLTVVMNNLGKPFLIVCDNHGNRQFGWRAKWVNMNLSFHFILP
jgi:hypothetical protein